MGAVENAKDKLRLGLFSGIDGGIPIFGKGKNTVLGYLNDYGEFIKGKKSLIFGIDPELERTYDIGQVKGDDLEIRRSFLEQSTISFSANPLGTKDSKEGQDLYSAQISWLENQKWIDWATEVVEFLSSYQWSLRAEQIDKLSKITNENDIKFYSEIHNKNNRLNFDYSITNELSGRVSRKSAVDLLKESIIFGEEGAVGIIGSAIEGATRIFDTLYDVRKRLGAEEEWVTDAFTEFKNLVVQLFSMKVSDTLKLWGGSRISMTNQLKFHFRQTRRENLHMVYFPLFYLLMSATPYSMNFGVDTVADNPHDGAIASSLTEFVPPPTLRYSFGNGLYMNEHNIITDIKIEFYDYKYSGDGTCPLQLKDKIIPTAQEVSMSIENILPLAQIFSIMQEKLKSDDPPTHRKPLVEDQKTYRQLGSIGDLIKH